MLLAVAAGCAFGEEDPDLKAVLRRLEQVERDNRSLREELRQLRAEIGKPPVAEKVEVLESRTEDLAQTKVESSQRMPISLTGMLLFNAFYNGRYGGASQYPVVASASPAGAVSAGASLRQTVIGLKFHGPDLPGGGTANGTLFLDFWAGSRDPANHILHIRTATLDLNWKDTTLTVGQDKPIFAPREPDSLAQVGVSPLTAAGNLWDWQPQIRLERRFRFGESAGLRAQAGVYMTNELESTLPAQLAATLERGRPGYQGRFEFWRGNAERRFEIAPGFHVSDTHVAGVSVPSRLVSLDWLMRPARAVDVTGAWFRGENVAVTGSLRQGFTILSPGRAAAVHSLGGWAQLKVEATGRLAFHFYGGGQWDRASDLRGAGIGRNLVYAGNFTFRLAPNVLAGFEASQTRTSYISGRSRLNNHYDLSLAYLF